MLKQGLRLAAAAVTLLAAAVTNAMTCGMWNAPQLAFGDYSPFSMSPHDIQGSLQIECTPASPGEILNLRVRLLGEHSDSRSMRHSATGEALRFQLYKDLGRTVPITDDLLFTLRTPLVTTTRIPIVIYGRIAPRQNVVVGRYRSGIMMQLDF